jgi:hypothetical protein
MSRSTSTPVLRASPKGGHSHKSSGLSLSSLSLGPAAAAARGGDSGSGGSGTGGGGIVPTVKEDACEDEEGEPLSPLRAERAGAASFFMSPTPHPSGSSKVPPNGKGRSMSWSVGPDAGPDFF